jgi:hypothetical protein
MRVPLAARWEMDPLAKWMRFNVFPRTLLLHLALLLTVTTQVVFVDLTVRALSHFGPPRGSTKGEGFDRCGVPSTGTAFAWWPRVNLFFSSRNCPA